MDSIIKENLLCASDHSEFTDKSQNKDCFIFLKVESIKTENAIISAEETADRKYIDIKSKIQDNENCFQENGFTESDNCFDTKYPDEAYIKEEEVDIKTEDDSEEETGVDEDQSFTSSRKSHTFKKTNNLTVYSCDECDYKTRHKCDSKKHKLVHQNLEKNLQQGLNNLVRHFCDQCGYNTNQKSHLNRHNLVHKTPEEISFLYCFKCSFRSSQKCVLRKHLKQVHFKEANTNIFRCNECSYQTVRKGDLSLHMVKHKNKCDVETFECEICSFETKYKKNLGMHMLTHRKLNDVKTYECSTCRFKTKLRYNLKRHYRSKIHRLKLEI